MPSRSRKLGRLVEQEEVGLGEEQGGERHTHSPAARKVEQGRACAAASKPKPARMRAARASAECASISPSRTCNSAIRCGSWRAPLREQLGALAVGGQHRFDQRLRSRPALPARRGRCATPSAAKSIRRWVTARRRWREKRRRLSSAVPATKPAFDLRGASGLRPR